ncbi:MAG: TetR/AcrR family transcriptional regulator [Caldilineaceae bacterium]
MNENDLRVQRTRYLLQQALIDLVTSKDYDAVTIRDITRQARVGYKTFFRHYPSKEALLQTLIDEVIREFQAVRLAPETPNAPEQNTLTALRIADHHAPLLRVIFQSNRADQLLEPIMALAHQEGKRFFNVADVPGELVAHHFATSMISLLHWWLVNEQAYSLEEMADYIDRLLIRPLKELNLFPLEIV